ncbi:hypothetical protein AMAG_14229 [Allomyces macrogynus ATCC 38327]|uniref:Cytochrome b561 domain-containing protein n=1 Tax=Allomyces macrogynus (strain ATCC 38327) TaxID=578462 RepID=A0A0L0T4D1_ALLM3|nr:hypothetical protein AMAG_14229 [Allomyces macrogynus ATCC 38327]|eukprot:KNE69673.1 hypothetical protein AMAG_14229 [Allomyces macrogynus ATCC 38327]
MSNAVVSIPPSPGPDDSAYDDSVPTETTPILGGQPRAYSTGITELSLAARTHLAGLAAVVVLALTVTITVWTRIITDVGLSELYAWHPLLMSTAATLFVTAIAVAQAKPVFLRGLPIPGLRNIRPAVLHGYTAGTAVAFAVSALIIIIRVKSLGGEDQFSSPHGIAGLVAVILAALQAAGGVALRTAQPGQAWIKQVRSAHRAAGYVVAAALAVPLWFGLEYLDAGEGATAWLRAAWGGALAIVAARALLR